MASERSVSMGVQSFVLSYIARCREFDTEPISAITSYLPLDETVPADRTRNTSIDVQSTRATDSYTESTTLNIRSRSINAQAALALAKALENDEHFTIVDLGDCYLNDVEALLHLGCASICQALLSNTTVTSLDLRGNNIRAEGATAIARLLRVNKTIKSLSLEWNAIGLWENGFRSMMEALANNKTLSHIDLRNNRIGPSSGSAIAMCLKMNDTLRKIDLRWNNLGILGGRDVADGVKYNFTLIDLDLGGNDITEDNIKAVDIALVRNRQSLSVHAKEKERALRLQQEIEKLQSAQSERLASAEKEYKRLELAVTEERKKLTSEQEELIKLQTKLAQETRIRSLQELRVQDLEKDLEREKRQASVQIEQLEKEIANYKQMSLRLEENNLAQINSHARELAQLQSQLRESEKNYASAVSDNISLTAKIGSDRHAFDTRIKELEDTLKSKEKESSAKNQTLVSTHEREREQVRQEHEEKINSFIEQLTAVNENKVRNEQMIQKLRDELLRLKLKYEEQITQLAMQSRQDQDALTKTFQDKLAESRRSIEELNYELQRKNREVTDIREEKERRIRELERSFASEKETKAKVEIVCEQHEKTIAHLNTQIEQLRERIAIGQQSEKNLRDELIQHGREHESETRRLKENHERMMQTLKEQLAKKESQCDEMRQEFSLKEQEWTKSLAKKEKQIQQLNRVFREAFADGQD